MKRIHEHYKKYIDEKIDNDVYTISVFKPKGLSYGSIEITEKETGKIYKGDYTVGFNPQTKQRKISFKCNAVFCIVRDGKMHFRTEFEADSQKFINIVNNEIVAFMPK